MDTPESLEIVRFIEERIRLAPSDSDAEEYLRTFIEKAARRCPLEVLQALALHIVRVRRAELQRNAQDN